MARSSTIEQLAAAKEIVITTGSGGVGKTTTAAALGALAATHLGGKVLVLTVDPAKRLANALGLVEFGNTETRVDPSAFEVCTAGGGFQVSCGLQAWIQHITRQVSGILPAGID